ncbi:DUF1513 domain-containing protein [Acidovorax sp.]|uniref:DUF1513 domain-containing protein n=1 Tax=Acidovorax sp. TaxID=1872122 RepID=UPI0026210E5D|nr:DUF1513 domain-containing protein [Acidovorax sp.]
MTSPMLGRRALLSRGALTALAASSGAWGHGLALAATAPDDAVTYVGAAWRGPKATDTHYAGVLAADWGSKKLSIRYAVPLPTRPHGLVPLADGGLLINGVRPGTWLMRCDGAGKVVRQVTLDKDADAVLFSGHTVPSADGKLLYSTEIDYRSGRGRIGVRDAATLRKEDEWDSGGIDPHQVLLDGSGHVVVANGGLPRNLADTKYDHHRMESTLVRINVQTGGIARQWRLDDPRLGMRHIAWSRAASGGAQPEPPRLGVSLQAEHDSPARRAEAPILAVLENNRLELPSRVNDGYGYSGDITPAHSGGFVLSSNKAGLAQLWQPGAPDKLSTIVQLQEAYALTHWTGPQPGGGVLVATAPGLVRWHPTAAPAFLVWPQPMALDNHWVLMG